MLCEAVDQRGGGQLRNEMVLKQNINKDTRRRTKATTKRARWAIGL